jgi:hypothetical protein
MVLATLPAVVLLFLGLSYFDLASFRYDDGLKVRIGPDPAVLERQNEILQRQKEIEQGTESERKLETLRTNSFGSINALWYTYVDVTPTLKDSIALGQGQCEINLNYQIDRLDYSETTKDGTLSISIQGSSNNSTCTWGIQRDVENGRIRGWRFANPWRGTYQLGGNNFSNVDPIETSRVVGISFEGSVEFEKESFSKFHSHLIQKDCLGSCLESNADFEITPSGALVYRGPNFLDDGELTLYMKKSRGGTEEK